MGKDMKRTFLLVLCCLLGWRCGFAEEFRLSMKAAGSRTIRYFADHKLEQGDANCEFAVIQVHGVRGGDSDCTGRFRRLVASQTGNDRVLFFAPCFPSGERMPEDEKRDLVYWGEDQWQKGFDSPVAPGLCVYDVLDGIFQVLNSPELYPKLKHVLFCGYSAGGQVMSRYVAVAKIKPRKSLEVDFAAGAPSTWLYFDDKRVDQFGKFKTPHDLGSRYNNWHLGFARPARYAASMSQSVAMRNLSQRGLLCFCGTEDVLEENLSMSPGAMLQGKNRYERFENYRKHIQRFPKLANAVKFVEVPGAGHEGRCWDIPEVIGLAVGEKSLNGRDVAPKKPKADVGMSIGKSWKKASPVGWQNQRNRLPSFHRAAAMGD